MLNLTPNIAKVMLKLQFPRGQEKELDGIGAIRTEDERWLLPKGRR